MTFIVDDSRSPHDLRGSLGDAGSDKKCMKRYARRTSEKADSALLRIEVRRGQA